MRQTKMVWLGIFLSLFFLAGTVSASANPLHMLKVGFKEVLEELCKKRSKELVRAYILAGGDLSQEALERVARESVDRAFKETTETVSRYQLQPLFRTVFNRGVRRAGYKVTEEVIERQVLPGLVDTSTKLAMDIVLEQAEREVAQEILDELIKERIRNRCLAFEAWRALKRAPVLAR